MAETKRIKILEKGPYEVDSDVPLKNAAIETSADGTSMDWKMGEAYDTPGDEPYHLCRCGHSHSKPFCDGTHKTIGFEGTEYAPHAGYFERAIRYEGEEVDLMDDESLCSSMRFCDRGPQVWGAVEQSATPGNKQLAAKECACCAAGRLTLVEKDGTIHEPYLSQEVSPVQDTAAGQRGPLWVKGGIELEGADGRIYEIRNRMTLCRCGKSNNMPFCDISHMQVPQMRGFDKNGKDREK